MAWSLTWFLSLLGCRAGPPAAPPEPRLRRLGIYYGWPSAVEGSRDLEQAARHLGGFEVLVLGAGLQQASHPDHRSARAIVARLRERVEIYGYLSLAGPAGTDLTGEIGAWHALGAHGIFFDEAGYDFGTTRQRQNQAFRAARRLGLRCFANAFDPDDLFADHPGPRHNPTGEPGLLGAGDAYLYESFVVRLGQREDAGVRRHKLSKLQAARARGLRLFGITTPGSAPGPSDLALWAEACTEARRLGFEGLGWGQHLFGASDGRLPPRELRP